MAAVPPQFGVDPVALHEMLIAAKGRGEPLLAAEAAAWRHEHVEVHVEIARASLSAWIACEALECEGSRRAQPTVQSRAAWTIEMLVVFDRCRKGRAQSRDRFAKGH